MNTHSKILISACLVGINCRYNAQSKTSPELLALLKDGSAIFMCPEQLGGLPTPREAAEIEFGKSASDVINGTGKVLTKTGIDITAQFLMDAHATLKLCKELNINVAFLKAMSPSCGSTLIYDGTFSGNKTSGNGITAELLIQNGIEVYDENTFPSYLEKLKSN